MESFLRAGDAERSYEAACISLKCMDTTAMFRSKFGRVFSLNYPDLREKILTVCVALPVLLWHCYHRHGCWSASRADCCLCHRGQDESRGRL